MADKSWKNNNLLRESENTHRNYFSIYKDGKRYNTMADNLYDAVRNLEISTGLDFSGCEYEESSGIKPIRKGIVNRHIGFLK